MNTTLLLYLNGEWKLVDLYEDLPISIMIQETDITDLQGRKSPYSKQFSVPGTNNNNRVFEEYFEVNGTDFDPLVKISSTVQYRGTDIFNGILRLQSVVVNDNYMEYNVYIIGEVGDFISELKDLTLQQLNYTDLLHERTYANITLSWEATDDSTSGLLGGNIIYPMVNCGLPYGPSFSGGTNTFPDFDYNFTASGSSFSLSGNPISPEYFKPAVRVYEVVKKVFAATSYSIESDFFETEYFNSLYMDTFQNGKLSIDVASAVTNQNLFISYTNNKQVTYDGLTDYPLPFRVTLPGGSDPLNNFEDINFRAPYTGNYSFNVRFNYASFDTFQVRGDIRVVAKIGNSPNNLNTVAFTSSWYKVGWRLVGGLQGGPVNEFFTLLLTPGKYVGIFIEEGDSPLYVAPPVLFERGSYILTRFNSGGVVDPFIRWDLYNSPTLAGTQIVDIKLGIPNLRCVEFLKGLITMFNLVVVQDQPSRTIKMVPYNEYYNEPDRVERDWTQKLDLTSSYRIEPLSFDLPKEINYTYDDGDEEYLNKIFTDINEFNYGRFKFVSSSNLLTDVQEYVIPFSPLPTSGVTGSSNFIIPQTFRDLNSQQAAYTSKAHIFFWVGNRFCYTDSLKQTQGFWYFLNDSNTPIEWTTYPCISHMSSLDIYDSRFVSDLNFISTFDFYGNSNVFPLQTTPYTLYNSFWRDYLENNYSKETRRFIGRFWLYPLDLYETKLTDKIFVKDSFYRIEKISEGNLIEPTLTEVSLIKERGGYYDIVPPSPYYFVEPNTPYPPTIPDNPSQFNCYTSLDSFLACNGTAPIVAIFKQGPAPIQDGSVLYTFDGSSYIPLLQGTYVRWTGGADTYVVINNIGQVIQTSC
jgi:hypothetical protein